MSVESNKAALRRYFEEFWDKGNDDAAHVFNHPNCVVHFPDSELHGPAEVKAFAVPFRAAFSNISVKAEELVGEGDMLAGHWTCHGIHTREFMGIAATGNTVAFGGFFTMRLVNGQRLESWELMDTATLMSQLTPE